MADQPGVNGAASPTDDRGVPLTNLQAEMSRKLADMEAKIAERFERFEQKFDSALSVEPDPANVPEPQSIDEREELRKISASPRRYVEEMIKPLREENEILKKQLENTARLTTYEMWERQQDRIARQEGKKSWDELPSEDQNGIVNIVKEKGWGHNPASAMDAYEIYKARKIQKELSDPDRVNRINGSNTEGSGRVSGKTPTRTLTRSTISELASTHPKHPDYKKNMETLQKIQGGEIRVE